MYIYTHLTENCVLQKIPLYIHFVCILGLPRTLVYVGQKDVLRDDSVMFVNRLTTDRVPHDFILDPEGYHGSFWQRMEQTPLKKTMTKYYTEYQECYQNQK